MGYPVPKSKSPSQAKSFRERTPQPRLLPMLMPIFALGVLAMLHVISLARLSELNCENQRLERLGLEQDMRHGELMRERARLTNSTLLWDYAAKHNMVSPKTIKPVQVGLLPAGKLYWTLPSEAGPGFGLTGHLGLLPQVSPASAAPPKRDARM